MMLMWQVAPRQRLTIVCRGCLCWICFAVLSQGLITGMDAWGAFREGVMHYQSGIIVWRGGEGGHVGCADVVQLDQQPARAAATDAAPGVSFLRELQGRVRPWILFESLVKAVTEG